MTVAGWAGAGGPAWPGFATWCSWREYLTLSGDWCKSVDTHNAAMEGTANDFRKSKHFFLDCHYNVNSFCNFFLWSHFQWAWVLQFTNQTAFKETLWKRNKEAVIFYGTGDFGWRGAGVMKPPVILHKIPFYYIFSQIWGCDGRLGGEPLNASTKCYKSSLRRYFSAHLSKIHIV